MKIEIERESIGEWLTFGIVLFGILKYFSGVIHEVGNYAILGMGILLIFHCVQNYNESKRYLFLMVGTFFLGVLNIIIVNQNVLGRNLLVSIGFFSVALYIVITPRCLSVSAWTLMFIFSVILVIHRLFTYGVRIFEHHNRNHVSAILFVTVFFVVYALEQRGLRPPMLLYIAFFLCCIFAYGRMGIIGSGINLALILWKRIFNIGSEDSTRNRFFYSFVLIMVVLIMVVLFMAKSDVILKQYFSRFVIEDSTVLNSNMKRLAMLEDYLAKLTNVRNLLFGVNTMQGIRYANTYGGNVHNAYFLAHAEYGIIGLIFVIYGVIKGSLFFWKNKFHETVIVLISFYIRSLTDDIWRNDFGTILVWVGIIGALYGAYNKDLPQNINDKDIGFGKNVGI